MTEKNTQLDLSGKLVKIKEKKEQCPYCYKFLKIVDSRHLLRCPKYRQTLPLETQNRLNTVDSILMSTTLYLPKEHSQIILPNEKILDFIYVDGQFVGFLPQLSDALGENYDATRMRYKRLCSKEIAPNMFGITYQKKITTKRLLRNFNTELGVRIDLRAKTRILLREDDMIFLASKSTKAKDADLIVKYLIDFALKAKYWITDLIYKLGRCNNREFKFLCAWLRLGWALEEIEPQRWYRLPTTNRRIDFRFADGKLLVGLDNVKEHDRFRDITTDREFVEKGKLFLRFDNSEVDENPLKVVRDIIRIAKKREIYIKQEVLPTFIKGFLIKKNKEI